MRNRARLEEVAHVRLVRAALLEEALEHLHRGSFAEPARARKERDARIRRQHTISLKATPTQANHLNE